MYKRTQLKFAKKAKIIKQAARSLSCMYILATGYRRKKTGAKPVKCWTIKGLCG